MSALAIYEIQQQRLYILIPSLHVGEAVQEEFRPTRGIINWITASLSGISKSLEVFLLGLLDFITKYAKTVSDNVVASMFEAHIAQTLILQK